MQGQRICPQMVNRQGPPGRLPSPSTTTILRSTWRASYSLTVPSRKIGISSKVRCIVQAIFAAATVIGRIRQAQQDGGVEMSEPFNAERHAAWGYILPCVLHRKVKSNIQTIRSREPCHDSGHRSTHRPHGEV